MQIENSQIDSIAPLATVRKRRRLLPALLALGCIGLTSFAIARNLQSNFATPQRSQQLQPFDAPAPYQGAVQVPYQVVAQTDPRTPTYNPYNPYNPQPTAANPPPVANLSMATTLTAPIAPMNQIYAQAPAGYARAGFPNSPSPNVTYATPANVSRTYTSPTERAAAEDIVQLVNKLRQANGEKKSELRKSLNEAVSKQFELRHAAQAKQVEKLEAELAEAKELHKKRGERKDEITERRIAELLESADDLAWNRELVAQPRAPSNYSLPNGNAQPYFHEMVPPSGPNQPYPYGPPTRYYPNSTPLYPVPQSSTPSQFNPLNAPDAGQPSLLQSTPSVSLTYSNSNQPLPAAELNSAASVPTLPEVRDDTFTDSPAATLEPAANQIVKRNDLLAGSVDATVAAGDALLEVVGNKPSNFGDPSGRSSTTIIEAAYAYEEALENAIEAKELAQTGAVSNRELSSAKRNASKTRAIWNNVLKDVTARIEILKAEIEIKEHRNPREKILEHKIEIAKLNAESQSLAENINWAREFAIKSLETLEKQLEQSKEQKSEQPSESKS